MPLLDAGNLDGTLGAILLVIGLILSIPALIVLSLLLFELALLLLALPLVILARLLLPVPWTIDVSSRPASRRFGGWQLQREVRVAGWRESSAAIHELRREAADGTLDRQ
jgi:Zn-dependent membrane protease YugP